MKNIMLVSMALFMVFSMANGQEKQPMVFDFEASKDGWDIPDWTIEETDYVTKSITLSDENMHNGTKSLAVQCDFSGETWQAAVVEFQKDMDLSGYKEITAWVYLPKDANTQLINARIIVTAGPLFWIEMANPVYLAPGKWVKITAKLDAGEKGQLSYWKCNTKEECIVAHLDRVRKIAVRIEYNASTEKNTGAPYAGPVFIDDIEIK